MMEGVTLIEEVPFGAPLRTESAELTPELLARIDIALDELLAALNDGAPCAEPVHLIALAKIVAMTAHGRGMPLDMLRGLINRFYIEAWRGAELPSRLQH